MRPATILVLLTSAYLLTACAGLTAAFRDQAPRTAPQLDPAPKELTVDCDTPVVLPERDLTQAEVEALWEKDRLALQVCGDRHKGTVAFYQTRDSGVTGRFER